MEYNTVYWDSVENCQKERPCNAEEIAEIEAMRNAPISVDDFNAPILQALETIDKKSIRALREGDQSRIISLETEAVALRSKLKK